MTSKRERQLSKAGQDGYHRGYHKPLEELTAAYDYGFKEGEAGPVKSEVVHIHPWLLSDFNYTNGVSHPYWRFQNYAYDVGFRDGRKKYDAEMDRLYVEMLKRSLDGHNTK